MPLIGRLYPGITPLNVWQLTITWWEIYVRTARTHLEQLEAQKNA